MDSHDNLPEAEMQYLWEQLNWFRLEAKKYALKIELLADKLKENASQAQLDWLQSEAQRYIRLTEDLAGRIYQATNRNYWIE